MVACSDQSLGPDKARVANDPAEISDRSGPRPSSLLADRAWIVAPAEAPLVSTTAELSKGVYRFQDAHGVTASIRRDDVILALVGGERVPRRVLRVETEGDVRVLDTGPALWSDAINSGRYGVTASLETGAATTLSGEQMSFTGGMPIPPLGGPFEVDICKVVDSIAATGGDDMQLCDKEQTISKTVKSVKITLAGSLDSLAILDGDIELTGTTAIEMTIGGGGVTGGTPPVFAPCHLAAYPGCLTTPAGAAWIDWLRRYAPSVPEASLRPARVCVPGSPIRVKAGYWEGLRWVPPQYQTCRIASIGVLPTVIKPSLQHVTATVQPRLTGGMTLYAQGDGRLGIRFPIPKLAIQRQQSSGDISAEFAAGFFVDVGLTVKNTSGWARAELDEEIRIIQTWTPNAGWSRQTESIRSTQTFDYGFGNPDSLVMKVFLPVAAVGLSMTVKPDSIDDLTVKAAEGVEFGPFAEVFWSREQVHPNDPDIDNWHLADEKAYELKPSAGVELPEEFQPPNVETSWSPTYEFGRVRNGDTWGLANLSVETATTGTDIDADGYTVVVSRSDTLPVIIQQGAVRTGPARDHGTAIERTLGATDTVVFERPTVACGVAYSDAEGSVVKSIVRKAGVDVPNYALVSRDCNLLVARHTVQLSGVAANCTVQSGAVRDSVWLLQRRFGFDARTDTTRVVFNVQCGAAVPMGAISVTAAVPVAPGTPFELRVDGAVVGLIGAGETKLLTGIAAGARTLSLHGLPFLCAATPQLVNVMGGQTANVTLVAHCAEFEPSPGTVSVRVTHTGTSPNDVFALVLDGTPRATVSPGGEVIIDGLVAGSPSTLLLTHLPGHCRVVSRNPLVTSGGVANFDTECTAAAIDTIHGTVAATAFPVPFASIDPTDGSGSLRVTGPLAADFLQLAGMTVRVRGVRAGTSLEVYSYDVLSSAAAPRWIGIVAQRGTTVWLFGEEAIELVDAPPELAAKVGALVWVGGDEAGALPTRVVPRFYGVIREPAP